MEVGILTLFLFGLLVMATEILHHVNKAAVAMFVGVVCWVLYICYGADFVLAQHETEFFTVLHGTAINSSVVKEFISHHVFFKYFLNAASVVLFLLSTLSITEVLETNGCFDFLHVWLRTRSPHRFLWTVATLTFLLSANLDNLTVTCLMLAMMHTIVADERDRLRFGSVIVVAANCGGAFTAIGDVTSLTLWNQELISPTHYSLILLLPCLVALVVTTLLVERSLPAYVRLVRSIPPYRGDDSTLNLWQRALMGVIGIGGLWFIPTYHRITHLPSFSGALCVLGILWIVHELCNHRLLTSGFMSGRRSPMALQFQNLQNILLFIGLTLSVGAVCESGILPTIGCWAARHASDYYFLGIVAGIASSLFNNVSMLLLNVGIFSSSSATPFQPDGLFWPWLSYTTALGGSLLFIGTTAGFALWRMESITLTWYIRHILPKVFIGALSGGLIFKIITYIF